MMSMTKKPLNENCCHSGHGGWEKLAGWSFPREGAGSNQLSIHYEHLWKCAPFTLKTLFSAEPRSEILIFKCIYVWFEATKKCVGWNTRLGKVTSNWTGGLMMETVQQHIESTTGGLSTSKGQRWEARRVPAWAQSSSSWQSHLTMNIYKLKTGVWSSLQIHFQEQFGDGGCKKLQPKSSLQLHLILPYLTQRGYKTVSSQIVTFIRHNTEQAKQFTCKTVPKDVTTTSFQPGTYKSHRHLPVGLQTYTWRNQMHPPREQESKHVLEILKAFFIPNRHRLSQFK